MAIVSGSEIGSHRPGSPSFATIAVAYVQNCTDFGQSHTHNTQMLTGDLIETHALTVRCPTCDAGPGFRCERVIGGVRPQSHLERRLIASDKVPRKSRTPTPTKS